MVVKLMTPVDAGFGHCKSWRLLSAIARIASLASRATASPSKEGVGSSLKASGGGAGPSAMIALEALYCAAGQAKCYVYTCCLSLAVPVQTVQSELNKKPESAWKDFGVFKIPTPASPKGTWAGFCISRHGCTCVGQVSTAKGSLYFVATWSVGTWSLVLFPLLFLCWLPLCLNVPQPCRSTRNLPRPFHRLLRWAAEHHHLERSWIVSSYAGVGPPRKPFEISIVDLFLLWK